MISTQQKCNTSLLIGFVCIIDFGGLRTNGSTTYSYIYDGSRLSAMSVGSNQLYFFYDAFGTPQAVVYNGTQYRYITNLQGDIVEIRDANDSTVVTYTYDAWGKLLTTTGTEANTLGTHNPLRYRGYVYDTETELYYLQSRYYNPTISRFINADALVSTGQGLLGNNMFAYYNNAPIILIDTLGSKPSSIEYCVVFEGAGGVSQEETDIDITDKLNDFMQDNARKMQKYYDEYGYIKAVLYFYENVTDGGDLDIKLQDEWKFEEGKSYTYNGIILRYDDPGNINFGYVGAVLFPELVLCFGAGVNQISKYGFMFGDLSTFYDDPRDNEMIKLGYSMYMEEHQ